MSKNSLKPFLQMRLQKDRAGILRTIKVTTASTMPDKLTMTGPEWRDRYLEAMEETQTASNLNLIIDSRGGAFYSAAGMTDAILRFVKKRKLRIRILIDGACGSAATYVCYAVGKEAACIQMTEGSHVYIHMPKIYRYARKDGIWGLIQKVGKRSTIAAFAELYKSRTGTDRKQILEWMESGKTFYAKEALEYKFCDAITTRTAFEKEQEEA